MGIFDKYTDKELSLKLAYDISLIGGKAYYVGGYVRDSYLGIDNKDIDIEVYGVTADKLRTILSKYGEVLEHGKSFGVFGIKGYNIDISIPRTERCIGIKHTDFDVIFNPFLSVEEGAKRRDLTINAMMYDITNDELVDPYNGKQDLDMGIIRYVNEETFIEDPLRVLRVAQFASRFNKMQVSTDTIELCSTIDISNLSKERVYTELEKALMKSNKPSIFFNTLKQMNQLNVWFPEVKQMIDIPQSQTHHQEGNVYNHTMLVIDNLASTYRDTSNMPMPLMLSGLCHDMGKIITTEIINEEIHAYNHEHKGLELVFSALYRLTNETKLINTVLNTVELHMRPHQLFNVKSKVKKTNQLFDDATVPEDLIKLAYCDTLSAKKEKGLERTLADNELTFLLERYQRYLNCTKDNYIMGKDLINSGCKPGKYFSEVLSLAHKLQLAEVPIEQAWPQVLGLAKKLERKENIGI